MRISIVSPSFNQVAFIQKTIESVAEQSHADKEHIVVDGGSTDGCSELVAEAEREHSHIRTLIEPDRGQADAINKGFRLATGDILAWLNTDDYYSDPDVLAAIAEYFAAHPDVEVAWGRGLRVGSEGRTISEAWVQPPDTDFKLALQHSLGLLQPSVFFRRSVFETVGGLSEEFPLQLDYEYWIRIAQAGFRFGFIDRILSHAVVHADAKSTAQRMQQLNECLKLVREKFDYVPIEWIRRYGEFFLTRKDHKVTKGLRLDESQQMELHIIEKALLETLNGDERTQVMLRERADIEPYANTYRAICADELDRPRPRRVVITSFDSDYLQQGLNLIAALHRTSIDSFDELLVYPLGLSEFERVRVASLEKVRVVDYPSDLADIFPEYLDPKTRAYKSYAIRSAEPHVQDGDLVLWMDAGLAPLKDIDEIFTLVDEEEFFITNHDDKDGWPFFNVNFAHRESHKLLNLDNADLLAPHLCSALVGYKRGGKYQHVVDDAHRLGQIREAVIWPKVPTSPQRYKPQLTLDQQFLRDQLARGEVSPHSVSYDELVSIFDYLGHRTQVIYSVLVHRAGAPIFSAKTYRRSNDESSRAAVMNWSETALHTDRVSSPANVSGIDPNVAIYHHRGIYNNLDGMRYRRDGDALFVLGNGPSLRGFPFESLGGKAWLGMNAAYRYWSQIGLYPTYYSCFDEVVLDSHRDEIVDMITNRDELCIHKFFLRDSILRVHPELRDDPSVYFLEDLERDTSWFARDRVTTGSFSVLVAAFLGYREVYLLGMDLNYVERLPESIEEGRSLKLAADPDSNPNYFFDRYQLKGDRFNPPNRHPGMHLRSWAQVRSIMSGFPIRIKNLNPNSAVREFEFEDYRTTLRRIGSTDRLPELVAERVTQIGREKRYWREVLLEQLAETSPVAKEVPDEHKATVVEVSDHQRRHMESGDNEAPAERRVSKPIRYRHREAGSLADLKDIYRGERAFVLGDTLNIESAPLALLKDQFTFAINAFYQTFRPPSWKPTFYVVSDDALAPSTAAEIDGLTGSTFFFDEAVAPDRLRAKSHVLRFERNASGVVDGVDLFEGHEVPAIHGGNSAIAAAIQLAYHMGFDPVYLVNPDTEISWAGAGGSVKPDAQDEAVTQGTRLTSRASYSEMRAWHRSCRDAFHKTGRSILNTTVDALFDIYPRADISALFTSGELPEFERARAAHVDETQVIASMFDRAGTMIDVGAHRGNSALPFVRKGWIVFCFEPDPENRKHLVGRLGHLEEVTIDPRAVGETPAKNVPFFSSSESSGISGLSAFRDTHELQGGVDMTSVEGILDEFDIPHVDFLKIDVEGFDLSVLKGVPWERIQPDVIECEFEDAKTMPMGHSSGDIAEYLRSRGYTVYISEWHPVIRYGIRHDWRRVVPYPGIEVPSNSWGNLLAFKKDPGYEVVQHAFSNLVQADEAERADAPVSRKGSELPSTPMTEDTLEPTSATRDETNPASAKPVDRAIYADFGDRLRERLPGTYKLLRFMRRSVAWVWRHKWPFLLMAVALVGLVAAGFAASEELGRYVWWGLAAFVFLASTTFALAAYSFSVSQRLFAEARVLRDLRKESRDLSKKASRYSELERRLRMMSDDLTRVESTHEQVADRVSELRASFAELDSRRVTVEQLQSLEKGVGDLASSIDTQRVYSNYSNASGVRIHNRWLSPEDIGRIRSYWLRIFGLSMSDRELGYMAHKICMDEERCEGRLATTIQAAMVRALALLSLDTPRVELLEIGVLSGISAGTLYRTALRAQREVNLTLIDPLTGYYGDRMVDGQTGVAVNKETVIANLAALGVGTERYRIVERKSGDPEAVEMTSDRQYDYLLIDGDHSLHGVSTDFELYGPMVRPGGIVIFDDYDTDDWPAIKPYVDEHVRTRDEWLWIGGEWRTGVLQKKLERQE